ncbi:MAG: MFS transporter [Neorhizobium sp.]|jgi:ACS family glucarate transporter-like MFS transporter|nr:MFS transporter [Neorhizobium sp.]
MDYRINSSTDSKAGGATTSSSSSHVRYWMLALIMLLSTIAYADRSVLSIAGSGIRDEFGLTPIQLGYILSAFSWAYVLGQIPGGLLLDRFGTRAVYGTTAILWSIATFAVGFVGELTADVTAAVVLLFALRFALGFIEAPGFPANARLTLMWFPKEERGFPSATFSSASYFAVAIFSPLSGYLVSKLGWPAPFFLLGVAGAVAAVLWFAFMREPRQHPNVSNSELDHIMKGGGLIDIDASKTRSEAGLPSGALIKSLLSRRMLWCAYLGQYCAVALSYFFITWFPIYLVKDRGMDILNAGFAAVAPSLFGFAGGILGGYLSDLLVKRGFSLSLARKIPFVGGMLLATTLVCAALTDSNTMIIAIMTFAFFGKGIAAGAGTWTLVSDTAPREAVGFAGSIFNCVGNIAGIVTPIIFGYIVAGTGSYEIGLFFVGGHCLIAALLYAFVMGPIVRVEDKAAI